MNEDRKEFLELYKLHAELADRVSQRREGANRFYVSLLTGVFIFLSVFLRYGTGVIDGWLVMVVAGLFGILLSVSWFIVVRSYRQLNTGKFNALLDLEKKLAYPFFTREWELLGEGKNICRYWKLTIVETFLPICFCVFFSLVVLGAAFVITEPTTTGGVNYQAPKSR